MRKVAHLGALPAAASGSLAMLALAGVRLPSLDAALLAIALGVGVAASRARGALAGSVGGAGAAIVALVGAAHGHATIATLAGAAVAILPLAGDRFPRGTFRLLLLAAAALAAGAWRGEFVSWAAAVVLYAVSVERASAADRVDARSACALAFSVVWLAVLCAQSTTSLAFVAILAGSCALLCVRSIRGGDALGGSMLEAGWPLLDAVILAATGHVVLAIECVAVVPLARRLALLETA